MAFLLTFLSIFHSVFLLACILIKCLSFSLINAFSDISECSDFIIFTNPYVFLDMPNVSLVTFCFISSVCKAPTMIYILDS